MKNINIINMKQDNILQEHSDMEKGAYLGAIASIATADRAATEEEIEYIRALAEAAGLSHQQKKAVVKAATDISPDELKRCLDILKNSDLKYSLLTDLIAFAKSDADYSEEEKNRVEKIAQYLNVNHEQFSLLDQFVSKTSESGKSVEDVTKPGFLDSLGLGNAFRNAGLGTGSDFTKKLLGIAGPMILGALLSRGLNGGSRGGGMLSGGPLGGMLGGGRRSGRFPMPQTGGLGGLFSILAGGRSFRNSGGLLSGLLR